MDLILLWDPKSHHQQILKTSSSVLISCLSQTIEVAPAMIPQYWPVHYIFQHVIKYIVYCQMLKVVIKQSCDNFGHSYLHLTLWDNKPLLLEQSLFYGFSILKVDSYVVSTFVNIQASPRRKCVATEITWNTYSFQMFRLNVISY